MKITISICYFAILFLESCATNKISANISELKRNQLSSGITFNEFDTLKTNYDGFWLIVFNKDDSKPIESTERHEYLAIIYYLQNNIPVYYKAYELQHLNAVEESTIKLNNNNFSETQISNYNDLKKAIINYCQNSSWYGRSIIYQKGIKATIITNISEDKTEILSFSRGEKLKNKTLLYQNGPDTVYTYSKSDTTMEIYYNNEDFKKSKLNPDL